MCAAECDAVRRLSWFGCETPPLLAQDRLEQATAGACCTHVVAAEKFQQRPETVHFEKQNRIQEPTEQSSDAEARDDYLSPTFGDRGLQVRGHKLLYK